MRERPLTSDNNFEDEALRDDFYFYPLDFYLTGTPISLQAKSSSITRWKKEVGDAARNRLAELVEMTYLETVPVCVTIYYFPIAAMDGDIDNIVKPILDALIGVTYLDDSEVERVVVQKFEPGVRPLEFRNPSDQLATVLDLTLATENPPPLVYIHLTNDLTWRDM